MKKERTIELQCGHFDWENCVCPNKQPLPQKDFDAQEVMKWKPESGVPSYARHNDKEICGFFGTHRILSNFWQAYIYYGGRWYPSTEHAFQFAKLVPVYGDEVTEYKIRYEKLYIEICAMSPGQVKRWASPASFEQQGLTLRSDWEDVKYDVMMAVVFDKFFRHRDLRKQLLDTGDRYLEETNTWRDKTWGVCERQGKNWLGKILMKVRAVWQ